MTTRTATTNTSEYSTETTKKNSMNSFRVKIGNIISGATTASQNIDLTQKPVDAAKTYKDDPIVLAVLQRVKDRSTVGMQTYGVPMTRPDISTVEWLRHAQEEALDLAVYLERVISDLEAAELDRDWKSWLP